MNTLKDSKNANSPDMDMSVKTSPSSAARSRSSSVSQKPKTPLRKDELEQIAKELKRKLSKASVAAKQQLTSSSSASSRTLPPGSPVSQTSLPKSSPLKNYYMWRRQIANGTSKNVNSSPNLYSPDRKSPTSTKPSVFLSSSPLKNLTTNGTNATNTPRRNSAESEADTEPNDSPTKRRRADSGAVMRKHEPQMVLQPMPVPQTPPKREALHPSPVLSSNPQSSRREGDSGSQTTPKLAKKQLSTQGNLLKTPTQQGKGDSYNDEEGADLLMYLATSPSVSKPYSNTPRSGSSGSGQQNHTGGMIKPSSSGHTFMDPPPPLTPKRTITSSAKTPQNRLTPSVYNNNLAVPGSALPSAGLALTPAGFNMNDYVNFFTPSPGAAAAGNGGLMGRTLMRTPDFHGQMQNTSRTTVDGKMINFDKAELFGASGSEQAKD